MSVPVWQHSHSIFIYKVSLTDQQGYNKLRNIPISVIKNLFLLLKFSIKKIWIWYFFLHKHLRLLCFIPLSKPFQPYLNEILFYQWPIKGTQEMIEPSISYYKHIIVFSYKYFGFVFIIKELIYLYHGSILFPYC